MWYFIFHPKKAFKQFIIKTIREWNDEQYEEIINRNTKEIIDYLNTDEDGDEFFSVKMNGMSFK